MIYNATSRNRYMRRNSSYTRKVWEPPLQYGVDNSNRIIPDYYIPRNCKHGRLFEIDFFATVIDSIKNLRKLTMEQLTYLRINPEKNFEVIKLYDDVLQMTI